MLRHAQENPGDFSVHKITDFVSQKDFRGTTLCSKLYAAIDGEYQIAMPFIVQGSASVAIVFNRSSDFDERDRELLTLLQPIISSAYLNVQKMTDLQLATSDATMVAPTANLNGAAGVDHLALTQRQSEVFRHLVRGRTNKQIAAQLRLSVRTIEKYVEHLLKKLDVPTRAAACAQYQSLFREAG